MRLNKDAPISDADRYLVEQLYQQYRSTMFGVAFKILNDAPLAEDAVSEALIKIIRHRNKLTDIFCHKTRAYIVSIIRTTSYDLLQKRNRHVHVSDDELLEMPDTTQNVLLKLTAEDGLLAIKRAIHNLPR